MPLKMPKIQPQDLQLIPLQWLCFILAFSFSVLFQAVYLFKENAFEYFNVSATETIILEQIRDYSFLTGAVLVAPILRSVGYKQIFRFSVLILLGLLAFVPFASELRFMMLLVMGISLCFAVCTVSSYASLAVLARSSEHHASMVSLLEGFAMVGSYVSYWLFGNLFKNHGLEWYYAFWVMIPLFLLVFLTDWSKLDSEVSFKKRSFMPRKDFAAFNREILSFSNNSIIVLFVFCLMFAAFSEVHYRIWITHYQSEVVIFPSFLGHNFISLTLLLMGIGRILTGILLLKVPKFWLVALCSAAVMIMVYYTEGLIQHTDVVIVEQLNEVPASSYLVLGSGVFLACLIPMIYSSLLAQVGKFRQSSLLCLTLVITVLSEQVSKRLSYALYEIFTPEIAYYFILIPVMLLFILFALFYHDLQGESKEIVINLNEE